MVCHESQREHVASGTSVNLKLTAYNSIMCLIDFNRKFKYVNATHQRSPLRQVSTFNQGNRCNVRENNRLGWQLQLVSDVTR